MPYRTEHGRCYHMTPGCHGATIPCGIEGLSPCRSCTRGVSSHDKRDGTERTRPADNSPIISPSQSEGSTTDTAPLRRQPADTISPRRLESMGRRLAYVLRHHPESIGASLSAGGWASTRAVLDGLGWDTALLEHVVATDGKGRYELSDDRSRVRALHGHSVDIDLSYEVTTPPPVLYHGTASRFVRSIERDGILPMGRQFVHLSVSPSEAAEVGSRHGRPIVLTIDAQGMVAAGYEFHLSGDGVWLVSDVPPEFVSC